MDQLLSSQDREEALSLAYVQAVAAGAGYVTAAMNFDRDGIDLEIKAGGGMRPSLGIQLKATTGLRDASEQDFKYPLKRRNYDLLRIETQTPRVLIVLKLPPQEEDWLKISSDALILRHCAYWISLANFPQVDNDYSVTIPIPRINEFNVQSLKNLMSKSRSGVPL